MKSIISKQMSSEVSCNPLILPSAPICRQNQGVEAGPELTTKHSHYTDTPKHVCEVDDFTSVHALTRNLCFLLMSFGAGKLLLCR